MINKEKYFSSTLSPLNNQSSESSENSATSDSSESEGEDNHRSDEEDSSHRSAQPEVKNEPPEENEVKKWNLGSFLTEQKSPNEAPQSHEPLKAVKNESHESNDDESNDDSEGEIQTPPSERNFNHLNENSNNSSIPDKSSDHEQSMPPPAVKAENKNSPIKANPDMEHALAFIKTLQPIQPIQPLSSLSDSDGKKETSAGGSPVKNKKKNKRPKPPVSVPGDSSSDEENVNSQHQPPSSKIRRRTSLENTKNRGRPPKKSSSSNSLPASYDQQQISDSACNGAKKLPTPQHKSPRGSSKDTSSGKRTKNVKSHISKPTIASSDDSNMDDDEVQIRSPSKKSHPKKSTTPRHPELSNSIKKHPPPRSSSSASSSSSSSQSDSDHSTKNKFSRHNKMQSLPVMPISQQSRPSSSLQHHLPPAASSVHRNDSSEHSDSDESLHNGSKGKVKQPKNPSGNNKKDFVLTRLFNKPTASSEGLGKGGKNGGKKPIGQVVVVTEEAQPKLNNENLNICHVQNHPKYSTASPSSAFSNNISSASNVVLNPSVMVSL